MNPHYTRLKRRMDPVIFDRYLESRGLTLEKVSEGSGISSRLLRTARKNRVISLECAVSLGRFLNAKFDDFMGPDNSDEMLELKVLLGTKIGF